MKIIQALAWLLVYGLVGCSGTPVKFNVVDKADAVDLSKGRPISASASGFQLLLFIPININSRLETAHSLLQAQAAGGQISDIKVTESWTYALVGTVYTTTLEATAYPRSP